MVTAAGRQNSASVPAGEARFTFAHAADAPAVQVTLTEQNVKPR